MKTVNWLSVWNSITEKGHTMHPPVPEDPFSDAIITRLAALAPDQRAEVRDFVDFLLSKKRHGDDAKMAMAASEPVCARYWDNEDDAGYDTL